MSKKNKKKRNNNNKATPDERPSDDPVEVSDVTLYEDVKITPQDFGASDRMTSFPGRKEDISESYMEIPTRRRRESLISSLLINVASFIDV